MVPKGWSAPKLGDFMDFKNGINTDKSQYGSGVKFVNVMDVFGNDILKQSVIKGRVQIPESRLRENLLQYGDILFNRTSETFEEIAMSAVYLDDAPATFGGFVIRGRDKNQVLDPNFSVYVFQSNRFRQDVVRLGQGAVRANIGQKDLSKVELLVPPRSEQKKIAQILSTWDKAITTTEQLLANSQQQKKALMQQLLTGKKRLLDENGVRFSGEWASEKLSSLCSIRTGRKDVNEGNPEGEYPFFTCASEPTRSDTYSYDCEALLVAGNGVIGKTHYFKGKFEAYQRTYILSDFEIVDVSFLHQYILYWLMRDIEREKQHGAMPYIKLGLLQNFLVLLPCLSEQREIAHALNIADKAVLALQQKLEALKQEKKALMQQLLTGKRRVKVDGEVS